MCENKFLLYLLFPLLVTILGGVVVYEYSKSREGGGSNSSTPSETSEPPGIPVAASHEKASPSNRLDSVYVYSSGVGISSDSTRAVRSGKRKAIINLIDEYVLVVSDSEETQENIIVDESGTPRSTTLQESILRFKEEATVVVNGNYDQYRDPDCALLNRVYTCSVFVRIKRDFRQ